MVTTETRHKPSSSGKSYVLTPIFLHPPTPLLGRTSKTPRLNDTLSTRIWHRRLRPRETIPGYREGDIQNRTRVWVLCVPVVQWSWYRNYFPQTAMDHPYLYV
jgi:hypothetical protein